MMALPLLDTLGDWLVRTTWQSAILIAGVVAIQLILGKRLAARWRHALWMIVVVRLLMPAAPSSPWSVFNLRWDSATETATVAAEKNVVTVHYGTIPLPTNARPERTREDRDLSPIDPGLRRTSDAGVTFSNHILFITRWLVVIWLAGAIACLLRVVTSTVILRRRMREHARQPDAATLALLDECRREMALRSAPPVIITDAIASPALFGVIRPRLLLPPRLLAELTRAELRLVLMHELAHVKRRDALANAVALLAEIVHWFNPLVRWSLSRCRAEREMACDALAMSASETTDDYGRAVLRVAEAFSARRVPWAAVGMIHTQSQLQRRIAMIATFTPSVRRRSVLPAFFVLCLASCALTDGQSTRPSDTNAPAASLEAAEPKVDAAVQSQLEKRLPEVTFDSVPLEDVIASFRKETDANIITNWRALEAAGIDRVLPVTARLRNVSLSKALQIVLDQVGGDAVRLAYALEGNVLTITTAEELDRKVITRVYDVRDLLIEIPNFTDAPNFNVANDPNALRPDAPSTQPDQGRNREELVEEITTLIKETVNPDTWRDNGGVAGVIRELQGQLIITQTPQNQSQIVTLLGQLRESRAIQITVEARFVTIDLKELPEALKKKLSPDLDAAGKGRRTAFVSDDETKEILEASQKSKAATIVTAPRITLFNGQRAYVMVNTEKPYVAGFTAIAANPGGEVRYEPRIASASAGILFDAEATVSADRNHVALMLRPKLTTLEAMESKPFEAPDAPKGLVIQSPRISAQSLEMLTSVPDGQTLIVGGFVHSVTGDDNAKLERVDNLFMLVKPTIIIQREVEESQFPLLMRKN